MPVHIRYRKNKNGKTSVYLDVTTAGRRERKLIPDTFIWEKPKDSEQRRHNKAALELAEVRRSEAQTNLMYESHDTVAPAKQEQSFLPYFKKFQEKYTRKDIRKVDASIAHFKDFGGDNLRFRDINENVIGDFKKYLEDKTGSGETARAYFGKFAQVMKRAFIDKLTRFDIRTFEARFKIDKNNLKKETLDPDEIQKIAKTNCDNQTTKLAFLFCCFTGLDFVDVFYLQWKHITDSGLKKPRQKTVVGRTMPLHETALVILSMMDKKTEFVFQGLPNRENRNYSWSACDKTLKALVKRAEINKHITWHCARHSFGTNTEGDEGTIAQLLGHSDTKMVKVYRRVKQDRLRKAVDSLKGIEL